MPSFNCCGSESQLTCDQYHEIWPFKPTDQESTITHPKEIAGIVLLKTVDLRHWHKSLHTLSSNGV